MQALQSRSGRRVASPSPNVFCRYAPFFEELFKYDLFKRRNQECARKSMLYTSKLKQYITRYYCWKYIRSKILNPKHYFTVLRMPCVEWPYHSRAVKFNVMMGHPTWC